MPAEHSLIIRHALADGVEDRVDVGLALGVARLCELFRRIDRDDHDRSKYRNDADDHEYFDKGEATGPEGFLNHALIIGQS